MDGKIGKVVHKIIQKVIDHCPCGKKTTEKGHMKLVRHGLLKDYKYGIFTRLELSIYAQIAQGHIMIKTKVFRIIKNDNIKIEQK